MNRPKRGDHVTVNGGQDATVTDVPDHDTVCRVLFLTNKTTSYVMFSEIERNFTQESLARGLAQSAAGDTVDLGDFTQYMHDAD